MFMQTKKGLLRVCFVALLELAFYMSTVLYEDSITTARLGSLEFMCTISRLFDPRQRKTIFPLASVSRPSLEPTQPPVQWIQAVLSPG
jgi:hypothetical protein